MIVMALSFPNIAGIILISSTYYHSCDSHMLLLYHLIGDSKKLKLVDAPVSGGVKKAANGTLTVRI